MILIRYMEKVYSLLQQNTKVSVPVENSIIVHLKLTSDEIDNVISMFSDNEVQTFDNLFGSSNILKNKEVNLYEPSPYENNDSDYSLINNQTQDIINLNINNSSQSNQIDLLLLENFTQPNKQSIIKPINYQLMEQFDNLSNWPKSTSIHCWWCRHSFNEIPCCIPKEKTKEGAYNVYGCFCSFNCTLAFIYDENQNIWSKINLLKDLCSIIKNEELNIEVAAPSWKLLTSYGGIVTIENFRLGFLTINNSQVLDFPYKYNKTNLFIQSSTKSSNQEKSSILLKRKDTKKSTTIENSMGLMS